MAGEIDRLIEGDRFGTAKTLYHGGFQYLERLDTIFKSLDLLTVIERKDTTPTFEIYQEHLSFLKTLYKELAPKMSNKEDINTKVEGKPVKISQRKHLWYQFLDCASSFNAFQRSVHEKVETKMTFLEKFDEFEIELRCVAEDKGLLMPEKKGGLGATGE